MHRFPSIQCIGFIGYRLTSAVSKGCRFQKKVKEQQMGRNSQDVPLHPHICVHTDTYCVCICLHSLFRHTTPSLSLRAEATVSSHMTTALFLPAVSWLAKAQRKCEQNQNESSLENIFSLFFMHHFTLKQNTLIVIPMSYSNENRRRDAVARVTKAAVVAIKRLLLHCVYACVWT